MQKPTKMINFYRRIKNTMIRLYNILNDQDKIQDTTQVCTKVQSWKI